MIIIRKSEITDVYFGLLETLNELSPITLTPQQAFDIAISQRSYVKTFVAVDDVTAVVVGTASVLIEQKFLHGGKQVGHIEDVVVRASHRGQDLGAKLVKRCVEECEKNNCYKVILDCYPAVGEFYGKLGFKKSCDCMRFDIHS